MDYTLAVAGLAQRVAQLAPSAKHERLLAALRAADPRMGGAVVAKSRTGLWQHQRSVLTSTGELVHDDHRVFLADQLDKAGSAAAAMKRLQTLDYRLTRCEITQLFVIADEGGPQAGFIQALVDVEEEFVEQRLFNEHGYWRTPTDLTDLCDAAKDGRSFTDEARMRARPPAY